MDKAIIFLCVKENETDTLGAKIAEATAMAEDHGFEIVATFAGTPVQGGDALDDLIGLVDEDEDENYHFIIDSPLSIMYALECTFTEAIEAGNEMEVVGTEVLYFDEAPTEDLMDKVDEYENLEAYRRMEQRDREYMERLVEQILRAKLRGFLDDLGVILDEDG